MDERNLKVGDIIEIRLDIDFIDDGDEENDSTDITDYNRRYDIDYIYNGYPYCSVDMEEEKGYLSYLDDVEDFIKEDFTKSFEEVTDFEIFDVDKKCYNTQKAKIRVKAVKEE